MTQYNITVPHEIIAEEFFSCESGTAFTSCFENNCTPAYMPELLCFKIQAPAQSNLWNGQFYTTASLMITGRSRKGLPLVAFTHTKNPLNNAAKINETIALGLVNGAGMLSNHEFYKILEQQDDKTVFVLDYNTLYDSPRGEISLATALSHPFVIPFCGGQKYAEQYLKKYKQITQRYTINLTYGDDAYLRPLARLLYLSIDGSFDGLASIESSNNLLGLKTDRLFTSREKSTSNLPLETLIQLAQKYIAPIVLTQYEAELRDAYGTQHDATNYSADFPPPLPSRVLPPPSNSPPTPPLSSSRDLAQRDSRPPIPNALTTPGHLSTLHRIVPQGRPTTTLQSITSFGSEEKKKSWK